jgi:hypothetical protein
MRLAMKMHDIVRLKCDLPEENLRKGMTGVIVDIFNDPVPGYEVEFTNEKGETIAAVALEPHQIERIKA